MDAHVRRWAALGLAAARRRGVLGVLAICVPLGSMLTVLSTVAVCLAIWRSGPSYKQGLLFPAISELGVDPPQRRLYQVGFAVCGALLALGILMFQELAASLLLPLQSGTPVLIGGLRSAPEINGSEAVCQGPPDAQSGRVSVRLAGGAQAGEVKAVKAENLAVRAEVASGPDAELLHSLLRWGYLSAAGVVIQGVFTLERGISAGCFVHWGGAMLFMAGAMQHAKASNELYDRAAAREVALLRDRAVALALRVRHFILDYSSMVLFMVPLLMQVLPSSSGAKGKKDGSPAPAAAAASSKSSGEADFDPTVMNAMGVMQWGIILQFALYFCTYTADLRAAVAARGAALAPVAAAGGDREKDT